MNLAIISHTEHYTLTDGRIVGWGPTVIEINHLLEVFDTIYHVAMLYEGKAAPPSALAYSSDKVVFVPLSPIGGRTFGSKLYSLLKAPEIIHTVRSVLKKVDYFQLRTPTGMGVFLIPYLTLCVKKPGWFKYAGNWNEKHPPIGYRLQRWLLKYQKRLVTINGHWQHQPKHHLSFENPCLTDEDIILGQDLRAKKRLEGPVSFCFVGRLETEKGVERIIEAFKLLATEDAHKVGVVHFVGEGPKMPYFKNLCDSSTIHFQFHGALSRLHVFEIYKTSHFFLLPTTASEGFPKVIAEAMNFGCVPIVSHISAIGHYIKHKNNGILIDPITSDMLAVEIKNALYLSENDFENYLSHAKQVAGLFTFSHYNHLILSNIIAKQ